MDEVRQRLAFKWDELNVLETMLSVGGFDRDYARKLFRDSLEDAYIEGFASAEYMLKQEEDIEEELLLLAVDKEYDGESIFTKFDNYYENGDTEATKTLMESEFHRVYNEGGMDMARATGKQVYKTWNTMQDERVREEHDYLEGQTIPLEDKFVTLDLDEAYAPGGFSLASSNANCRCWLTYSTE